MVRYLVRRLLLGIAVLGGISFLSFWGVASRINPLWTLILDRNYAQERAKIAKRAHLDESVVHRYWLWIKGIVTGGDSGHTVLTNSPIWPPIWAGLSQTAQSSGRARRRLRSMRRQTPARGSSNGFAT